MTNAARMVKLGRIAKTISGVGFPHSFQGNEAGEIPFLKVSDLSLDENALGVREANNWVSRSTISELGGRLSPAGSVVFPKVGAALLKNQRKVLLREAATDNNLMSVVPRLGDAKFLMYAMTTIDMGELSGSGPLPYVSESQVKDLRVPFPGVDEQRRISDFLDAEIARIASLVALRKRSIGALLEKRSSNIFSAVSGIEARNLRHSSLPWLDRIPEHWKEVRLGLVANMGSGHTPSRSRPDWWVDCTIPWITTGEVALVRDDRREVLVDTRERISKIGLANSSAEVHPKDTVVLCRTASAGYSAVMGTDMATSQDFVTWTCDPKLDPYYLLWCLRAMRPDLLGRLAMGSTHQTIYVPDLQMLRIPLPEIKEQHRIVERIREVNKRVDHAVDAVKRQIDLLEERRRALITAAVTGQIDVTTARGADLS